MAPQEDFDWIFDSFVDLWFFSETLGLLVELCSLCDFDQLVGRGFSIWFQLGLEKN